MKCDKCNGTGQVEDQRKVGAALRFERKKRRVSLRAVADALDLSPAFISDLERGYRNWKQPLLDNYMKAVLKLSQ